MRIRENIGISYMVAFILVVLLMTLFIYTKIKIYIFSLGFGMFMWFGILLPIYLVYGLFAYTKSKSKKRLWSSVYIALYLIIVWGVAIDIYMLEKRRENRESRRNVEREKGNILGKPRETGTSLKNRTGKPNRKTGTSLIKEENNKR